MTTKSGPGELPDEFDFPDLEDSESDAFAPTATNPALKLDKISDEDLAALSREDLDELLEDDDADIPESTAPVIVNLSPANRFQMELQTALLKGDERNIRVEILEDKYKEIKGGVLAIAIYHYPDQESGKRLFLKKEDSNEAVKLGGEHASQSQVQQMVESFFEQIDSADTFESLDTYVKSMM